jgi:hypothetical protein
MYVKMQNYLRWLQNSLENLEIAHCLAFSDNIYIFLYSNNLPIIINYYMICVRRYQIKKKKEKAQT